jgi:hypothetical protein
MYSYALDKLWMCIHVEWLYFVKILNVILSCEWNTLLAHFVLKWLYLLLNLCLGIMLFSFGVKDPFVTMNV